MRSEIWRASTAITGWRREAGRFLNACNDRHVRLVMGALQKHPAALKDVVKALTSGMEDDLDARYRLSISSSIIITVIIDDDT